MRSAAKSSRFEILAVALAALLIPTACGTQTPQPTNIEQNQSYEQARKFYPMQLGHTWVYENNAGVEFTYTIIEYETSVNGMECEFDVYRQNETSKQYARWAGKNLYVSIYENFDDQLLELQAPLEEERTWRKVDNSSQTATYYVDSEIIATEHALELDSGTYETLVVRDIAVQEYPPLPPSTDTTYTYFSEDIGVVREDMNGLLTDLVRFEPSGGE